MSIDKREVAKLLLKHLFEVRVFGSLEEAFKAGENEPLGYPYAQWMDGDEGEGAYWWVKSRDETAYFRPCDDITAAWSILTAMKERIFSVRRRFLDALTATIRERFCEPIAWPDLLFFVTPADICLAALSALGVSHKEE